MDSVSLILVMRNEDMKGTTAMERGFHAVGIFSTTPWRPVNTYRASPQAPPPG